jgi:hypothetical protein
MFADGAEKISPIQIVMSQKRTDDGTASVSLAEL